MAIILSQQSDAAGIPVSEIDTRLDAILNDADHVRWPLEERIAWINDAASEIVIIRPAAGATTDSVALAEGVYQTIPESGTELMDVVRNIRAGGQPGRPIQRTDLRLLDTSDPNWYAIEPGDVVKHFTFDDRNPKGFYTYPPVKAGTTVELLYAAPPAKVSDIEDVLVMGRAYIGPLVSYVLYRALAKDSEYANGVVAAAHLKAFNAALGARNEISVAVSPKGAISEAP